MGIIQMLATIYFTFIFINLILYLLKRDNIWFGVLSIIFISLFASGRRYDGSFISYDLRNYERVFYDPTSISSIGYKWLNQLGASVGLEFETFYAIVVVACICLIFYFIRKNDGNIHLCLVPYMIYFVIIDTIQIRNLIALTLLIFTIPFLLKIDVKSKAKYIIGIIASALFHKAFYLYLILYFVNPKKRNNIVKIIAFFFIVFSMVSFIDTTIFTNIISNSIDFFGESGEEYSIYTETRTGLGFLAPVSIHIILFISSMYYRNKVTKLSKSENSIILPWANLIVNINLLCFCFYPFFILNTTPYRLVRNISFFTIIVFSQGERKFNKQSRMVLFATIMCITIGWFVFDIIVKGYWQDYIGHYFINEIFNF
jgi:hypothetical protein